VLDRKEALDLISGHLDDTPRAAHSRFVAYLMHEFARVLDADVGLWEIVGLCHDLDFFATSADLRQHGLLTMRWLNGRLPDDALRAIGAHDHRTGLNADTLMADMLKLADTVAVIDKRFGRAVLRRADDRDPYATLRIDFGDRSYLADILRRVADKHGLSFAWICDILEAAPPQ
jgi:predicted hydrolase (HD superfamily)